MMRTEKPQDVRGADAPDVNDSDDNSATEDVDIELVRVLSLRPTQLAIGYQAAQEKADRIAKKGKKQQEKYFQTHAVPVILGPDGGKYIIDHHHLCFAALLKSITEVYFTVKHDWSKDTPSMDAFWRRMQDAKYVWLNDPKGKEISFEEFLKQLPADVTGLKDDPYRSLAASVRRDGGYTKVWTPYAEFHWANFFRIRVPLDDGKVKERDVKTAVRLARSSLAEGLPGQGASGTAAAPRAGDRGASTAADRALPPGVAACSCTAVDAAA